MLMSPRALLRFGELYRNDGVLGGRLRTSSPYNGYGYGYGWFGKRARGHDVRFA